MDQLIEQVERARRRLVMQQFLGRLVRCLFATFCLAAVAIAVPKLFVIEGLPELWAEGWLIGSAVVALVAAMIWTLGRQKTTLEAAMEIDTRHDLRERTASTLLLPEEEQASPVGKAVLKDTMAHLSRIDVAEKFRLEGDRRAWLPLLPALLAVALMFFGNREATSNTTQAAATATQEQVKKAQEDLRKRIEKRRKEAEKRGLKDASDLLKQVEKGTSELSEQKIEDQKKSVVKLNNLAEQLKKQRDKLGGKEALERELQKMKDLGKGPAEKVANALKRGDWKKALDEIKQLQQKMAKGEMTPDEKKQLSEQLGKMKEQLQAASEARKQAIEKMKQQIEKQKQSGNAEQAGKLQQKLEQMQQQQQQASKLDQLAQKMGMAQKALKEGDSKQAAQQMQQMAQELEQMQQEAGEMEMLDAAMTEIEMAKQAMGCQQCQGGGCQACQGPGMGKGNKPGQGMGEGQGQGDRPDEKNPTNLRDTKVKQDPKRGGSTFEGLVEGPNLKGQALQSLKAELETTTTQEADATVNERLPRGHREHTAEYFERLRDGL